MKISVVTWNMDNWKRTHEQRNSAWTYLTENVSADIMLLQEFAPQSKIDDEYNILFKETGDRRRLR